MCRSDRFFDYSPDAEKNPSFPLFKTAFEDAVGWYDMYSDALLYTPHVTAFLMAGLGALQQAGLNKEAPYSTIFNVLLMGIPVVSTFIVGGSKLAQTNVAKKVVSLLTTGEKLGFFNSPPTNLPNAIDANDTIIDTPTKTSTSTKLNNLPNPVDPENPLVDTPATTSAKTKAVNILDIGKDTTEISTKARAFNILHRR